MVACGALGLWRAVRQSTAEARQVAVEAYAEQERLLADSTAGRLDDLARRIRQAASVAAASWPAGAPSEAFGAAFDGDGVRVDLLAGHEFGIDVDEHGAAHHHPIDPAGEVQALSCAICLGQRDVLPIVAPLQPGDPSGPVLEIEVPLSLLGARLPVGRREDSVWWADRASGTLLASPSSQHIGADLRAAAGPCGAELEVVLDPGARDGGVASYCWPAAEGPTRRVAGYTPLGFLGLQTVVGVSTEERLAAAAFNRAADLARRTELGILAAALSLLLALGWSARRRLRSERAAALDTLTALSSALEARDRYTRFHSENVGIYAAELGRRLGRSREEQGELRVAGRMHDLGKIGICDGVLQKPGALSAEDRHHIERHAEIGERILRHLPWAGGIAAVAGCHHERMDGGGYPRGLRGKAIPDHARIVAVADVFDALLTDRPYRTAMTVPQAMAVLAGMAGSHLDPVVLEAVRSDPDGLRALGLGARPADPQGDESGTNCPSGQAAAKANA